MSQPDPSSPRFRIAVASDDAKHVDLHFGHAKAFQIFDVEGSRLTFVESRPVPAVCDGGDHDLINLIQVIAKLRDCQAVLAVRIGPVPHRALSTRQIRPFALPDTISSAVKRLRKAGFPGPVDELVLNRTYER